MKNKDDDETKDYQAKQRNLLTSAYKEVFRNNGDAGMIVLRDILNELKFFSFTNDTQTDTILQKACKKILCNAGIWTAENVDEITRFMLAIEPTHYKEN